MSVLVGPKVAALSVWVLVTGADHGIFSGAAACGFAHLPRESWAATGHLSKPSYPQSPS